MYSNVGSNKYSDNIVCILPAQHCLLQMIRIERVSQKRGIVSLLRDRMDRSSGQVVFSDEALVKNYECFTVYI